MDNHIIMVEKIPSMENLFQDMEMEEVSVVSGTPIRITAKGPVRITAGPIIVPLRVTAPEPIPYS